MHQFFASMKAQLSMELQEFVHKWFSSCMYAGDSLGANYHGEQMIQPNALAPFKPFTPKCRHLCCPIV
eukprot:1106467-Amphidinium_carterae.1